MKRRSPTEIAPDRRRPRGRRPPLAGALACAMVPAACSTLPVDYPKTASRSFGNPGPTEIGAAFEREARRHPGKCSFVLVPGNREAFTDRVALADFAQHTIDAQYFIWQPTRSAGCSASASWRPPGGGCGSAS